MSWRIGVTRAALLLMESMWTYAVVAFAVALAEESGKPSFLAVLAVVFVSYGLSRFLQSTDLDLGILRIWGTLLSVLVFYLIVRLDFYGDTRIWDFGWADDLFNHLERTVRENGSAVIGVPLLWVFWMRGILRGQQVLGWDNVLATFGLGVLIIGVIEVFQAKVNAPALVGLIAVPYVAIGLIALSLAHAARAESDVKRSFTRTWFVAAGSAVLLLGGLALLLALFDLVGAADAIRSTANGAAWLFSTTFEYIIWPIAKLTEGLFIVVRWLMNLILGAPQPPRPQPEQQLTVCVQDFVDAGKTLQEAAELCREDTPDRRELPGWLQLFLRILVAAPVVALLLVVLALLFTRFQRRRRPGEVRESAYHEGRLASDLGGLLGSLLGRLRPHLPFGREQMDAVRRLYFEMVETAESHGLARRPAETPLELAPRLDAQFSSGTPGEITSAFDDVRYGAHPPSEEDARRLREEWQSAVRGESG